MAVFRQAAYSVILLTDWSFDHSDQLWKISDVKRCYVICQKTNLWKKDPNWAACLNADNDVCQMNCDFYHRDLIVDQSCHIRLSTSSQTTERRMVATASPPSLSFPAYGMVWSVMVTLMFTLPHSRVNLNSKQQSFVNWDFWSSQAAQLHRQRNYLFH